MKPGNLLVDQSGVVKVLDLGLARFAEVSEENPLTVAHDEKVLGTADYLSPEQALDSHLVDHRADIYSLGCTIYFALTGHPPFKEGTIAQRLMMHQTKSPPPISETRPDVPADLVAIVSRMIEKKPEDRFQSMAAVSDTFTEWLKSRGASMQPVVTETQPVDEPPPVAAPLAAPVAPPVAPVAAPVAPVADPVPMAAPVAPVVAEAPAESFAVPVAEAVPSVEVPEATSDGGFQDFLSGLGDQPTLTDADATDARVTPESIETSSEVSPIAPQVGDDPISDGTAVVAPPEELELEPGPETSVADVPVAAPVNTEPVADVSDVEPAAGIHDVGESAEDNMFPGFAVDDDPLQELTTSQGEPTSVDFPLSELAGPDLTAPAVAAEQPEVGLDSQPAPVAPDVLLHEPEETSPPGFDPPVAPVAPAIDVPVVSPLAEGESFEPPPVVEPAAPVVPPAAPVAPAVPPATPIAPVASPADPNAPTVAFTVDEPPSFPESPAAFGDQTFPQLTEPGVPNPVGAPPTPPIADPVSPAASPGQPVAASPAAGSRRKKKSPVGIIVAVVLVIAVGGGAAAFLMKGDDDSGKGGKSSTADSKGGGSSKGKDSSSSGTNTAGSSSGSGKLLGNQIKVGVDGDFRKINDALDYVRKNRERYSSVSRRARIEIEVVGGETYAETIHIDNSSGQYPKGIHVISRGVSPAKLAPSGSGPIIRLNGIENLHIEGFDLDASGRATAIELAGYLNRSRLARLNVTGFTGQGVLAQGAAGFSRDELILESVRLTAADASATGLKFTGGDALTSRIKLLNCQIVGPVQNGILFDVGVTNFEIRGSIIYQAQTGIAFSNGPLDCRTVFITNNTLHNCSKAGIEFSDMPAAASFGLQFHRNLFSQTGPELIVRKDYDEKAFDKFVQASGLSGIDRNWTDRSQVADPKAGERDLIIREEQRVQSFAFTSTDPSKPDFLRPARNNPYSQKLGGGEGLKPWIGAVEPEGN